MVIPSDDEAGKAVFEVLEEVSVPAGLEGFEAAHRLSVDYERLKSLRAPAKVDDFIRMPGGMLLLYDIQETEDEPPRVWRGRLYHEGQAHGSLTISRAGERFAGAFRLGEEQYAIRVAGDGGAHLLRRDDSEPPPHGPPRIPPSERDKDQGNQ